MENTRRYLMLVVVLMGVLLLSACGGTKEQEVKAQALTNLNLRAGPGTNYSIVGKLPAGSEITVIGRDKDGSWLHVKTDEGSEVWLTADPTLVEVDEKLVAALPVVEAPPPPYDASNPAVNKILNEIPLIVYHANQQATCASHGGLLHLLPEVQDGNVIGPHSGDFVYKGNNVLFRLSGGTPELIWESDVARFEGGAKSLSFEKAMKLFESGEISWNGHLGDWPGRGVTGCDPHTP